MLRLLSLDVTHTFACTVHNINVFFYADTNWWSGGLSRFLLEYLRSFVDLEMMRGSLKLSKPFGPLRSLMRHRSVISTLLLFLFLRGPNFANKPENHFGGIISWVACNLTIIIISYCRLYNIFANLTFSWNSRNNRPRNKKHYRCVWYNKYNYYSGTLNRALHEENTYSLC